MTRLSALPVLTAHMAAPLRFSKATPADSPERVPNGLREELLPLLRRGLHRGGSAGPDAADATGIGFEDAELQAGRVADHFALAGHPPGQGEYEAADRVEIGAAFFRREHRAHAGLEILEREPRIEV